jgi:23S rRNA pseudouridine2605 synthase
MSHRHGTPARNKPDQSDAGPERLQKVLAHAGVGSRRACEELILQGRVTINGQTVRQLGTRVDPRHAHVAVDGQTIHEERAVYFAVHKPKGYVSSNYDPAGKPRVVDLLPEIPQRVYTVGRLDEQSTGLLILTNDGALANRLAHPKFGVEKVYRVVVAGEPSHEILTQLTQGIWLAEGKVRARRVRVVGKKGNATVLELGLAEGKNREIRRMMARFGHKVMSLTRIAVGPVGLKGLGVGQFRPLSGQEVELLRKVAAGLPVEMPRFPDRRERKPRPGGRKPATQSPLPPRAAGEAQQAPYANRPAQRQGRGRTANRPRPRPSQLEPEAPAAARGPLPSGPSRPQRYASRRPSGQAQYRPQGQDQGQGQSRAQRSHRPPAAPGPAPRAGAPKRAAKPSGNVVGRKIIGLESAPANEAGPVQVGPPGPRLRRPTAKRPPRAAMGIKRPPKKDDSGAE